MKKFTAVILAVIMLLALVACGNQSDTARDQPESTNNHASDPGGSADNTKDLPTTQILTDNVGREVDLPYPIKTCVVAHRLNNELIRACGASDRVIAVDQNTAQDRVYFSEYDFDNTIGKHQQQLDFEKIVKLNPQVLIVPYNCDYDAISSQLEPFGIKVFVLSANKTEDFAHEVTNVGKMFGVEEQAQKVIDYFEEKMDYVDNALKDVKEKTVYAEYLTPYQAELPFDGVDVFSYIHAKNVFGNDFTANTHDGKELDPEDIISRNPDAIVRVITPASVVGKSGVSTPPEATEFKDAYKEMVARTGFSSLNAVENDNVMVITAFGETAAFGFPKLFHVAKMLYPEQLKDFDPDEVWRTWMEDFQGQENIEGHFCYTSELK